MIWTGIAFYVCTLYTLEIEKLIMQLLCHHVTCVYKGYASVILICLIYHIVVQELYIDI